MPATQPLLWGAEALWLQLEPLLPGLTVEVVASTESTNTTLLNRARGTHGPADTQACLLVAEQQTRGRGRQGKDWLSSAGASLTFSLALPLAPADWSGLSLAVGLALADALDPPTGAPWAHQAPGTGPARGARLGIKWPNDLLVLGNAEPDRSAAASLGQNAGQALGRKVGGILIETVQAGDRRLAVVGVGLNVRPQATTASAASAPDTASNAPPATATPALSWGYACLQELQPGLDAPAVLAIVAPALVRELLAFERHGFAPLRQRFAARDVLMGRAVVTTLPGLPRGVADGVDDTGTLWLRVPDIHDTGQTSGPQMVRRRPVASGEVSLRPDPGTSLDPGLVTTDPAAPAPRTQPIEPTPC